MSYCVAQFATIIAGENDMPSRRIDLNRLQIFRTIVLAGSITKAAQQLRQPKSRVSRQLSSLEEELGAQLIFRTTRSLQLTPFGRELTQSVMSHLNSLEDALDRLSSGDEEVAGRIRISVPDDIGTQLMGRICHSFLAMYPKVDLDVHVGNQRVDLVRESFDLALRIGKLHDSTLLQKRIGIFQLTAYLSPELRAKYGAVTSPDLAFTSDGTSIRLKGNGEQRRAKLQPVFVSNSFFVLRDLAIQGAGLAVLPPFIASEAVRDGKLLPVLKDWYFDSVPAHFVMPNQKDVPLRIKKFMEHVRSQLLQFLNSNS
jgi:DNA-binding transcriptional LysR family regulator